MRLSQLIRKRKKAILQEFEDYARTHTSPGSTMDVEALRDHAAEMLQDLADDLDQPQTEPERDRKGRGDTPRGRGAWTAAEEHGAGRAHSGFSLEETFAEYRALRASVMRHWTESGPGVDVPEEVQDVIRFNEAIDQAIAESIREYARAVEEYREMFLAVLGHDLRSPLDAIMSASAFLDDEADLSERDGRLVHAIRGSGARMKDLIEDMLDYAASRLGQGLPLHPTEADLGEVVREVVRESETSHPERAFRVSVPAELDGEWDVRRIRQALLNLVDNAVKHGAPDSLITVSLRSGAPESDVVVEVHNAGGPIREEERERIFEPFQRGRNGSNGRQGDGSRGLGLYIARQMAEAHGGTLGVASSSGEGTTFSLRVPIRQDRADVTSGTPPSDES